MVRKVSKRVFCPLGHCYGLMVKLQDEKQDTDIVYKCSNCETLAVIKRELIEN